MATETGHDRIAVVLAWMLRSEPSVIPVIAASRREQLDENLAVADVDLSRDQLDRLDRAHRA